MLPLGASEVAEIMRALAALAWPAVALTFVLLFRSELTNLLKRILRVKGPGFDVELRDELDQLGLKTEAARQSVQPPPVQPEESPPRRPPEVMGNGRGADDEEDEDGDAPVLAQPEPHPKPGGPEGLQLRIERILDEASKSPRTALISLAIELERKSRELLVSQGEPDAATAGRGLRRQLSLLDLSPALSEAAAEFNLVRNRIVHGHTAGEAEAFRAIDLGIEILSALEQIPHEINYVEAPAVETFADADGMQPHDFKAVVLRAVHPPDGTEHRRAFPVANDLPEDEPVTWEWNMERIYPEAWFRDPRTDDLVYGWSESAEFAGRPIHDLKYPARGTVRSTGGRVYWSR